MKLEQKPKYFPLIQKPMLCNVTCLQMILYRRGFGLFVQEDMAYEMGLTLPKEHLECFSNPFKAADKKWTKNFWLELAENRVNTFFKNHNLPLKAKVYFKHEIEDVTKFISDNIKNNNDMWIMVANEVVYGTKGGHDIVIQAIDTSARTITIIDPSWRRKQVREEDLDKIFDAMDKKWGRERGFVIISKKVK